MANVESLIQTAFKRSWDVFKDDMVLFIVGGLIVGVVGGFTLGLLLPPLMVGFIRVIQKRLKGEEATFGDVFGLGFPAFLPSLLAGILIGLGVGIGMILLIIPGIAVAILTTFTFHFIAYEDASFMDALKGSFNLVKENFVPVLLVVIIIGALNSVGSMVAIGTLLTFPFGLVVLTVVFEELRGASSSGDASASE